MWHLLDKMRFLSQNQMITIMYLLSSYFKIRFQLFFISFNVHLHLTRGSISKNLSTKSCSYWSKYFITNVAYSINGKLDHYLVKPTTIYTFLNSIFHSKSWYCNHFNDQPPTVLRKQLTGVFFFINNLAFSVLFWLFLFVIWVVLMSFFTLSNRSGKRKASCSMEEKTQSGSKSLKRGLKFWEVILW